MEKIFIKNSRDLNLAADYYKVSSDKIIIMCHGFGYDRHEKENKFDKLADNFVAADYSVIKFDFSGVGESDDDTLSVNKQAEDLQSVINFVKSEKYKDIILFGVSFGSLATFKCYNEDIRAIVGVGPVSHDGGKNWRVNKFTIEQLDEFDRTGKLVFHKASGSRDCIVLDKQYYLEKEAVVQKELLSNIKCPVLIIHADGDEFIPLEVSQKAVEILGDRGDLHVLVGGTHAFLDDINTVADKTLNWLSDKI